MFSKIKDFYHSKIKKNQPQSVMRADQVEKQQQKYRQQQRKAAEKAYAQEHPEQILEEKTRVFEYKTNQLKKKLNIAIITVFGLIILVFLILFFI
ncbi:hypothetical protein [Companilactobacillus sp. HBUAS59544]|uniref:hypothetical protein n=1 Tax=Companilactobacillus sp. HBUAS59544 TaxID=3109363 RepID=UPI002FEFF4C5